MPATQTQPASRVLNPRRTSADLSPRAALAAQKGDGGAPSAAPATQNETDVLQVLRLPRKHSRRPQYSILAGLPRTSLEVLHLLHLPQKMRLRCSKCWACQANAAGIYSNYSILAGLPRTSLEVLHVLHLPRKMRLRCSKCCACHAK